jgi:hypothetical protein
MGGPVYAGVPLRDQPKSIAQSNEIAQSQLDLAHAALEREPGSRIPKAAEPMRVYG